jgi:hypothetical protein
MTMASRQSTEFLPAPPPFRQLRVFAVNPSLGIGLDVALRNQTTLRVPWELLEAGPIGEYLEVVDHDPPSQCFYRPVDLNHPSLLVQDGLTPSEASPQFHQQMVYAVAMATIRHFEIALGRRILWARRIHSAAGDPTEYTYVPRLRIYPHALREANSYYSPSRKALLFGYFPAAHESPRVAMPGGMIFTCLSPEIIAHETAHALIDGARPSSFHDVTNPDVLAFHEAFAEIVALFQSFTQREWLERQLAHGRGDLSHSTLLGSLAQQSGTPLMRYGALRDALGSVDPDSGIWRALLPDPSDYERMVEPLARGAILVAAIFDAYLAIFSERVANIMEIATSGTGVLPAGGPSQALVRQLAEEAARAARHVLRICIRALDYCPPVDLTFGDFLRAVMTADSDLVPDDPRGYRPAFVEAFRQRGIYPRDVRTLSVESLRWKEASLDSHEIDRLIDMLDVRAGRHEDRVLLARESTQRALRVWEWLTSLGPRSDLLSTLSLAVGGEAASIRRSDSGVPRISVEPVHPAWRTGPAGRLVTQLVINISQARDAFLDPELQRRADRGESIPREAESFTFRGGCTMLIDLDSGKLRYAIGKPVHDDARLERQRRFLTGYDRSPSASDRTSGEPFADLLRMS